MSAPMFMSAMKSTSILTHVWAGLATVGGGSATYEFTFSNTAIWRADSRFFVTPADTVAGSIIAQGDMRVGCTNSGTFTIEHSAGIANAGQFYVMVIGGPGVTFTMSS